MGQGGALGVADELQQGASGADRERQLRGAVARKVERAQLCNERARGGLGLEMPGRTPPRLTGRQQRGERAILCHRLRDQNLGRLQALELGGEGARTATLKHGETTRAEVDPREPEGQILAGAVPEREGREQHLASIIEQGRIGDRARCDHPYHRALDRSLGLGWIADLLADRHRLALAHQACEIVVDALHRNARHRDRRSGGLPACGQRDVEQLRSLARILEEELVEVSHPIEQQRVRMLGLQAEVLLHHRGMVCHAPIVTRPWDTRPRMEILLQRVVRRLLKRGRTVATAESCTGGGLARALTEPAGASNWFLAGWVVYSDAAKRRDLGVRATTLERHGAVSAATVAELARQALRRSGADLAVSISGIAGPGGAVPGKPIGTVWFGFAMRDGRRVVIETQRKRFRGDRAAVREAAVRHALRRLYSMA